jgi:drug/metabolite transporter (DMT)-like permease
MPGEFIGHHRLSGRALVLFAILCLSLLPPLVRVGLTEAVDPLLLLAYRLIIASVVLWAVLGATSPGCFRIDRRGFAACAAVAATDTTASLCYYHAFTHISTSVAHVVFSLYPAVTLLLLLMRRERVSGFRLVGLALALLGVYVLVGPGGGVNTAGVVLALGAATGYASTLVLAQWFLRGYDPRTISAYVILLMTLMMGLVFLVRRPDPGTISPVGWWVIVITAIVSTAVARLSLFAGIRRIGSAQTALLSPVETLLAVSWAVLFLGDRLTTLQLCGGLLILLSMVLVVPPSARPGLVESA